jgi:hypothetical protein
MGCPNPFWGRCRQLEVEGDGIALRRLNAQPGKTYYFRAQVLRSEGSGITLLDTVDEDQAQFLLQTSARAI